MPIYEFICNRCSKNFEDFVLSPGKIKDVKCPSCGSKDVRKQFSMFSCRTSGSPGRMSGAVPGSFGSGSCGGSSGFS